MGLILDLLNIVNETQEKKKNKQEQEKQCNIFELNEQETDLVKKGEYNPWNFEEEDLEEDDYYYEDENN